MGHAVLLDSVSKTKSQWTVAILPDSDNTFQALKTFASLSST